MLSSYCAIQHVGKSELCSPCALKSVTLSETTFDKAMHTETLKKVCLACAEQWMDSQVNY